LRADGSAPATAAGDRRPNSQEGNVDRPVRYQHHRFLGDKRRQVVYDVDEVTDRSVIDELVTSEQVATFGPDTLSEARNRGYRLRSA
jgi:hypothetical protein